MRGQRLPPRPDAPHPVAAEDPSLHVVVWITFGVNAALGLLAFAGWFARPTSCAGGCSWRPVGGIVWVLLAIVDVGLVLIWAGIGYLYLVGVGQRIGRRISAGGRRRRD
jgi:hypothetical protein